MRRTFRIFILVFIFILHIASKCKGQEALSDLTANPVLIKEFEKRKKMNQLKFSSQAISLTLPFIDDFSSHDVYPDSSRWTDRAVFVNRSYPVAPLTIGVATFDGLGSNGLPYNASASATSSASSDTLTSKEINLSFSPADSIYFSFYYQVRGLGNAPETADSLMLEFYSPADSVWSKVWSLQGSNPPSGDSTFERVMMAVTEPKFLLDGFRFRFRNKATHSGNVDHWHVDYVYLNRDRTFSDTLFQDVAFAYQGFSFLNKYQSVPWDHYQTTDTAGRAKVFIRNNFNSLVQMDYRYEVSDVPGTVFANYNAGSENIDPFTTNGYSYCQVACPNFSAPDINFTFPALVDTASFVITHIINPTADFNRENDTLKYVQRFHDYYAYDDGTAEAGYGLNTNGGMIAYRFTLPFQDTLRAIDMYFNAIVTNASLYNFKITIWNNSSSNTPGSVIYSNPTTDSPFYESGYYKFHRYDLDSAIVVPTTFYIGYVQNTNQLLNLGFDKNIDNSDQMFYNTTGNWVNTLNEGSWLMRPVFTPSSGIAIGEKEINSAAVLKVFPNPGHGKVSLELSNSEKIRTVEVIDVRGAVVYISDTSEFDLSSFKDGIYFIRVISEKGNISHSRYILSR